MRDHELLSRRWCDLVFEGRNRDYGAYVLRRGAGRRYALALGLTAGALALIVLVPLAAALYVDHRLATDRPDLDALDQIKRLEAREGHEIKAVAAGRHIPKAPPAPEKATGAVPEVADDNRFRPVGGDDRAAPDETDTRLPDNLPDTAHNVLRDDLPDEGRMLTPVELVSEMPEFPGGLGALMKWLDQEIPYPDRPKRRPKYGRVEVTFLVDEAGDIHEARISRPLDAACDRAVLEAIGRMPRWKPGHIGGRARKAQVTLPVEFHEP